MIELKIDPEFQAKIPPLTDDEFKQLRENIINDGEVYEPICVWNGVIVDGHNRWKVIQEFPDSLQRQIIDGMTTFYRLYYGNFKQSDLIKNLQKVSPNEIIRNGKSYTTQKNGYAREITKLYNKGRRIRLDENKL